MKYNKESKHGTERIREGHALDGGSGKSSLKMWHLGRDLRDEEIVQLKARERVFVQRELHMQRS